MTEPLAELMQGCYRDRACGRWSDGLTEGVRRKVEERFFRILYEADTRSAEPAAGGEWAFRGDLADAWRRDPEEAAARLVHRYGLRHWRFDRRTGQLQMVFEGSVYDGDVDHRH